MNKICGCCYFERDTYAWGYIPQVGLQAHAFLRGTSSRTTLTQTFKNSGPRLLHEVCYRFPLFDGVSVVGFRCQVGDRVMRSEVKTKEQASQDYHTAVLRGASAGVLDQSSQDSDIFLLWLGNVPPRQTITVSITAVGELKTDAQTEGIRYTLPNGIAPRYGYRVDQVVSTLINPTDKKGLEIVVDVVMENESAIRMVQSPSHPIRVRLGRTSSTPDECTEFAKSCAFATLHVASESHILERDFVLVIKADKTDVPRALIECHPTAPNQRAIMATLVPRFHIPASDPEVVFLIDRSGSMRDKISTLKSALRVFLKSVPVGTYLNICSFGTQHQFLWARSRAYDGPGLQKALTLVDCLDADMGCTEMTAAVQAVVKRRLKGRELEVLILTDGQIHQQQELFDFIRATAANQTARFFALGIGSSASHALVNGIARAGDGIAQSVTLHEELDCTVVRMLKGALSPHIHDYSLTVNDDEPNDGFEVVDHEEQELVQEPDTTTTTPEPSPRRPILLFDPEMRGFDTAITSSEPPVVQPPSIIQAPQHLPTLYPFIRTTVYLLLTSARAPRSLTIRASSKHGPLTLDIAVEDVGCGETIHQLAARKIITDLEESGGWVARAKDKHDQLYNSVTQSRLAIQECKRLGLQYQLSGHHTSFVAVDENALLSGECSSSGSTAVVILPHQPDTGPVSLMGHVLPGSPRKCYAMSRAWRGGSPRILRGGARGGVRGGTRGGGPAGARGGEIPTLRGGGSPLVPVPQSATVPSPSSRRIYCVIDLQIFDGSWQWSPELFEVLELDESMMRRQLMRWWQQAGIQPSQTFLNCDDGSLLATVLAIEYLQGRCQDLRYIWELVCTKAERWLDERTRAMGERGWGLVGRCRQHIHSLVSDKDTEG
ncbi:VIT and vWA domain-containing protein [Aspergillus fijiensis CBS 313.89]|uniref:von Willebrand domain protein n=1 Tax=Aspergillus fijiensis CBS 313.89 TaxID=1448319 RepID=A0A8G1RCQ6_9EURO|nr:uncharacterized protein BO72DRAFT_40077 [Aspergillus fijiensis CBS 313.89]RAK70899.1 hypothetical protein BO72DRAFT_40077 [Aspergillus fijiensis CBS 313.89]